MGGSGYLLTKSGSGYLLRKSGWFWVLIEEEWVVLVKMKCAYWGVARGVKTENYFKTFFVSFTYVSDRKSKVTDRLYYHWFFGNNNNIKLEEVSINEKFSLPLLVLFPSLASTVGERVRQATRRTTV